MSEPLYQRCPVCKGTFRVPDDTAVCDWPPELVGGDGVRCVCTLSSTPGWTATGLTLGQVDDLRRALRRHRRETASRLFDIAGRIGVACTPQWAREEITRVAEELQFRAGN